MREPRFWWRKPGLACWLLSPFALIYGAIAARRMRRPGFRTDIPVICVGNFTLGGTGKTPTAIAIAQWLRARGEAPFFLTRGYGGTLAGPVLLDPARHQASDVGDEPLLLARTQPTVVARDRAKGAVFAQEAGASIIVMDDGLQNPSLHKDITLAVVDERRGLGNAHVFPAGPLRAPLAAQLEHVHAILLIGPDEASGPAQEIMAIAIRRGLPLLRGRLAPIENAAESIGERRALAFAGIGDPDKFFRTLASCGVQAPVRERFPDHHRYSEDDANRLLGRCAAEDLVPVTTEKDLVRLSGQGGARGRLAAAAIALPVALISDDPQQLGRFLDSALRPRV